MRRYLPRLLLTGALLSPTTLWALGLGEIRLNSALNQPFDAEIELISVTSDELASLKVGLAGNDVFARYGIDRPNYLSNFDFSVTRTRDGRASIKVRSNRSVTEPFVTLLVEASWARGRLVREYTVLLDPPVFMPSQPEAQAPVTTPQAGAQTGGRIERPQPVPEPARPAAEPSAQVPAPELAPAPAAEPTYAEPASAGIGGQYEVQRNDTLWRIASQINPGAPSVVNQTMIALYRANPDAFGGNINRLRAGAVLRIPELTEIDAISTAEAAAEVARQTAEWSAALPSETTEEASRLRLVTPEESPTPPTAAPAPEEPVASATPAAPATTPSEEDRRLAVESPDLAGVQEGVEEAPVGEEAAAEEAEFIAEEPAAEAEAEEPVAEEAAQPERRPRRAPAAQEPQEPSLWERVAKFAWVPVVFGVLAFLLLLIRRRRSEASDSLDSLDSISPIDYEPPARRPAATRVRDPEPFVMASADDGDADVEEAPAPVTARREQPATRPIEPVAASEPSIDDTLSSDTAIRLDQQDALAEADFHMAYGLYDQAADLVKIAIEREPGRRDLKLKLLEIYFVWGNKDLFLETARDLHATKAEAAPGEWDKVLIMGKQIAPEDGMFQGEAGSAHVDLVDVNLEGGENRIDVDLFAEPEAEKPAGLDLEFASGEHQAPASGESDLDFLLDEPKRGEDEDSTRELDPLARTQETPTIESPILDRGDATIREKADTSNFSKLSSEQTAEISLDDLGLDAEAIDHSGSLEDTTSLEKDIGDTVESARPLRDDEMTQLAPSLGSMDRTMEAPRIERDKFDIEQTGTIYIDQVDLSGGGDTVEQPRHHDLDKTASMKAPEHLDVDLDNLDSAHGRTGDTARHARPNESEVDHFSSDVFSDRNAQTAKVDLDVGDALAVDDRSPTSRQSSVTTEMELSELEPVTMSEVGTKLDLARAYMDMGDPDGARSILEEVMQEGNPTQKQEANRLLESIR